MFTLKDLLLQSQYCFRSQDFRKILSSKLWTNPTFHLLLFFKTKSGGQSLSMIILWPAASGLMQKRRLVYACMGSFYPCNAPLPPQRICINLGKGKQIFSNWNLYSKTITDFAHGLVISLRRWTQLSLAWAAVHNITKIQLVVNSSVMWLLESATDTHQLSTWVHIHLPVGVKENLKTLVLVYNYGSQFFWNYKKNCLYDRSSFMKSAGLSTFQKCWN